MTAVLLDTHVWAWSFNQTGNISRPATSALNNAERVYVSPISFYEIAQKAHLGKWPDMVPYADRLVETLGLQGGVEAPMTADICEAAGNLAWAHRDPFDRLIGATARCLGIPLVTKDPVFASLDGVKTIW